TAFVLLLIGLGTNLYHYVAIGPGYAHDYLFCLVSITLFLLLKWYKAPGYRLSICLGLVLGLIVLIRPTLILLLVFVLLMGVTNRQLMTDRLKFILKHY